MYILLDFTWSNSLDSSIIVLTCRTSVNSTFIN